jgi:hypothetical protein
MIYGTGQIVPAWNLEGAWPASHMMTPILQDNDPVYEERSAVAGIISPEEFYVIGTTGTMTDGKKIATLLVGSGAPCVADCNGDGVLNILDFVCFQNKFVSGCP